MWTVICSQIFKQRFGGKEIEQMLEISMKLLANWPWAKTLFESSNLDVPVV